MEIKKIPLSLVMPSPMNPRKTIRGEELQELADNIEKQGLLQPITVRPVPEGREFAVVESKADFHPKYEIVCGERRYRAFSLLSDKWSEMDLVAPSGESYNRFSDIPAIVRDMSDEEAFDAMITENLQRKDVDPIEEAFAFGELIKTGRSAEEIAARFGKSVRFVTERIKLNTLIPELMLAVKEGRMPIVAALIICKLDEEQQSSYNKIHSNSYDGFSKRSAQNFVENLFMNLDMAVWNDKDDPGFSGGCGKKCSECEFNTSNHGCLFYEMNPEDGGRCTDRARFESKTLAFLLSWVDACGDKLVRKGEPLAQGKTVVVNLMKDVGGDSFKELKKKVLEGLEERNIEVIDPNKVFKSRYWYSSDEERTQRLLADNRIFRVLSLFTYTRADIEEQYWYLTDENTDEGPFTEVKGVPSEVRTLIEGYKREQLTLDSSLTVAGTKAIYEARRKKGTSSGPLSEVEKKLLMLFLLHADTDLNKQLSGQFCGSRDEDYATVEEHADLDLYLRSYIQSKVNSDNGCRLRAAPLLDEVGALWFPEEYDAARKKVQHKFEAQKAKVSKELAKLGYDLEGNPLEGDEEQETEKGLEPEGKQEAADVPSPKEKTPIEIWKMAKEKHPDTIPLIRVGDFYESFGPDAVILSEVLNLTLAKRYNGDEAWVELAGFPHHALDTYLPKLIRAGKRVAICE